MKFKKEELANIIREETEGLLCEENIQEGILGFLGAMGLTWWLGKKIMGGKQYQWLLKNDDVTREAHQALEKEWNNFKSLVPTRRELYPWDYEDDKKK